MKKISTINRNTIINLRSNKNTISIFICLTAMLFFSSCSEYLALGFTLAVIPEILFGIFIVGLIIVALIGFIIKVLTGNNKD
jgi:hypothetical protein